MVRALFPHAFRGRRLVNRDRFRAGGGQFERIGLPGLAAPAPLLGLSLAAAGGDGGYGSNKSFVN